MQKASFAIILTGLIPATLLLSGAARGATDGGTASEHPWSGYWWQHKSGGLTGPLGQYDRLLGTRAAQWERDAHVSDDVPDWFGHCHAWAASSVCEQEPNRRRVVTQVSFGVGDQKGLLAACHAQDVSNSYGDRFGDGQGSEDRQDLLPGELWRLLQMYVKQRKIPLILDLEAGEEVWNYPIYQYRVDYESAGDGWCEATMQLIAADNNVSPGYVGTKPALYEYRFRVRFEGGAVVAGSGQWTGDSADDHPDFAWYPYVAVAENPEVDVAEVAQIVGYAVGGSNPPDEDVEEGEVEAETEAEAEGEAEAEAEAEGEAEAERVGSEERPIGPPPPDEEDENPPAGDEVPVGNMLTPDELLGLVLNQTSAFALDIFVDKGDGGRYRPGEPIRVSFRSGKPGYLYLFDVGPQGDIRMVFPLGGQANRIRGEVLYDLPGKGKRSWFHAESHGQHDLKGIVTSRPFQITGFQEIAHGKPRSGQAQAGQQTKRRLPQQAAAKPQTLRIHPTAHRRIRQRLFGFFRKGEAQQQPGPEKVGPFAQDVCAYFVLATSGDAQPGQKTKPSK